MSASTAPEIADPKTTKAGGSASVRTRRIRETARDVLGYTEFRPGQEDAMKAVSNQHDFQLAMQQAGMAIPV